MNKTETVAYLKNHPELSKGQVTHFVATIEKDKIVQPIVSYLKKGYIYVTNSGSGTKQRPHVIIGFGAQVVHSIPLSTTKDELNLTPYRSRFLGQGHFGKSIVSSKYSFVMENFVGIFDNPKLLNKAIAHLKEMVDKI